MSAVTAGGGFEIFMLYRYFLALCVVTLLGAETWAAEHPKFVSQPVFGSIVIDGRQEDWSGAVEPFGTEPISIEVANDGTFLYLLSPDGRLRSLGSKSNHASWVHRVVR